MSFGTTSALAFLIEEHCDDFEAFEVSDERACSDICPNRKVSTKLGGTLYEHYSCYNSKRDKGGEYDVIDAVSDFATDYCYYRYGETPKEEVLDKKGCVKKAIEEGRDFIAVFTLNPSDEQELCSEKNGYELEDGICFKKCPKNKPLTGYAHDCYSCDTKYAIELDNFKGYSIKDEEFVNVCPNRAIIGGTSFKNQIDSCNTIEKVKKILADEEKYYQEDEG